MFKNLREDINSVFERDPAARNMLEIIFCYPGLHALWIYRIAHRFWVNEFFFAALSIMILKTRPWTSVRILPSAVLPSLIPSLPSWPSLVFAVGRRQFDQ